MMKKAKFFLLIFVVVMFAVSSIVSTQRHSQVTNLISLSMKTVGWAAAELEIEMLKFTQALKLTALNNVTAEDLQLRFELLWSRVDVLSAGEESRPFREQPTATELLSDIKQRLIKLEPEVFGLSMGDERAMIISRELESLQVRVRHLNIKSFSSDGAWGDLRQVHSLQNEANIFLLGLLISGCALILLVIRENSINRKQALHDSLTGLANRHFFQQNLEKSIARSRRNGTRTAIYMIDMNEFKDVNDRLGHAVGDALLQKVGSRLVQSVQSQGTVARLGGDEFGIIQERITSPEECTQIARHICEQINTEMDVCGHQIFPHISIGISIYPDDAEQHDKLLNNADTAMYCAKKDYSACYRLFEQEMNDKAIRYRILVASLRLALEHDQLQLVYQPIVCLKTEEIVSVEALLRWNHEQYGYISPLEVVSIAEQAGLAEKLNEWVLKKACLQNMLWKQACLPLIQVSVNISPAMYTRYDLVTMVTRILSETGLPPEQLVIEVTEDTTMQDIECSPDILQKLRSLGVELALDDFGTGYSSLSHLKKMPFHKLKIDKVFIQELDHPDKDMNFIRTIINLAHGLGMKVVAEGIEVTESHKDLYLEGCEYGQGYLFCKPAPSDEIERILRESMSPIYNDSL